MAVHRIVQQGNVFAAGEPDDADAVTGRWAAVYGDTVEFAAPEYSDIAPADADPDQALLVWTVTGDSPETLTRVLASTGDAAPSYTPASSADERPVRYCYQNHDLGWQTGFLYNIDWKTSE